MNGNVPKLRFNGFEDEWKEKKMASLGRFFKGNGISKIDLSENGKECILYGELYTTYGEVITYIKSKTDINLKNEVLSKINDVIIPSSGETAVDIATASCVMKDGVLLGGDLNVFRPNKDNGVFISYQLSKAKKKEIAKIAQGASVVHVYNEQLKKVKLDIPSLKEQEKIANFLSNVDKIIEEQEGKVKDLELYKKGMMQKIFKQEIRFKDDNGENYPEWEEKKLGEISEFTNGKAHENDIALDGEFIVVNSKFISSNGKVVKHSNSILCPLNVNDIAIVMSDVPNGKVLGKTFLIDREKLYTLNQRIGGIRVLKQNPVFIQYIINRNKYYLKFDNGVGQTNLRKIEVLDCPIELPCLEEQTKIANFLSNIDKIIEEENKKLEDSRKWRKGLLQQMFV